MAKRLRLVIGLDDLYRGKRSRLYRSGEEALRRDGQMRRLVLALIRAHEHPTPQDLAAALHETPPDAERVARVPLRPEEAALLREDPPADLRTWMQTHISGARRQAAIARARTAIAHDTAALCEYVAKHYVLGRPRKPGRKGSSRSYSQEMRIARDYFAALEAAKAAHIADSRQPRSAAAVKHRIAAKHRISLRTLETLISGIRARIY